MAMARADAGRRIDQLYEQIAELRDQIETSPAVTLQDAAVKLRRLGCLRRAGPAGAASGRDGTVPSGCVTFLAG